MISQVAEKFAEFYETWLSQLEHLLVTSRKTHSNKNDDNLKPFAEDDEHYEAIINKLTSHHKEYYRIKWALAREDVLPFFAPIWLSPFESAYLWVTGWKPSMAFRIIAALKRVKPRLAEQMSHEETDKLEALRLKISFEEEGVDREMERQQVAMADRKMVQLARLSRFNNGSPAEVAALVSGLVETALKELLAGFERVMEMADCVRLKTLKGVLDVLSPEHGVEFLAATSMLPIRMRRWGRERDGNKRKHDDDDDDALVTTCNI